jgi:Adenylate and Guanylate cyclase catalytic domain
LSHFIRPRSTAIWSQQHIKQFVKEANHNSSQNSKDNHHNIGVKSLGTREQWRRPTRPLDVEATDEEIQAAEAEAEADALAEIEAAKNRFYQIHDETEEVLVGSFFSVPSTATSADEKSNNIVTTGAKPMADMFSDTTVMFADISGFTVWSMTLQPNQVFTLLAKLHRSLDDMAAKRKILKVESVGDVYCAVAGVPEPVAEHAVLMAQYASDCRDMLALITEELATTLGHTTKELQFRIGLHSGPVLGMCIFTSYRVA